MILEDIVLANNELTVILLTYTLSDAIILPLVEVINILLDDMGYSY
jgi:hypothetical protein